jgi:Holliday junction resolvase RusA-like endonuclease
MNTDSCTGRNEAAGSLDAPPSIPSATGASAGRPATGPDWFVLDIPRPPSVNRFMRTKKGMPLGNFSPVVLRWREQADAYLLLRRPYLRIKGPYELLVKFPIDEFTLFDADNCLKALSDWLQRVEIIENDRYARRLVVEWGEAPVGCRIRVRAWREAT